MSVLIMPFLVAMIMSFIFTPVAKKLAHKFGAIDVPKDNRRVHSTPIPRMGGLAIFIGFIVSFLYFSGMEMDKMIGISVAAALIVGSGIVDDIYHLSAKAKLIVQIIASLIIVAVGIRIQYFTNPFDSDSLIWLHYLSVPMTVFWIVGITNTVNLIDGLDGLAAGISMISSITLAFVAMVNGNVEIAMMTVAVSGACLGFLPYNFNPAKIFMGDAGSLFLGFILAVISIEGTLKSTTALAFAIPILALGLPIFDTTFAIVRRMINNRPIMEADKGHLHHRLLSIGMNQKRAVLTLYLISVLLGMSAIFLAKDDVTNTLIIFTIASVLIFFPISRTLPEGSKPFRK